MKGLGLLIRLSLYSIAVQAQTSTTEPVRVTTTANTAFNQYGKYLENKEGHFLSDQITSFEAESANGAVSIHWQTGHEDGLKLFQIEYSPDGDSFQTAGTVFAANTGNGGAYRFRHEVVNTNSLAGRLYYRLKIVDNYGSWTYSKVIQAATIARAGNYIYPTFITTRTVSLFLNDPFNTVEVLDMSGRLLAKQEISRRTGRIDIALPSTAAGTCIIRVAGETDTIVQKVLVDH